MQALAKFAMKGRRQAILAAILLGVFPVVNFLSAPIVALVWLRHGKSEGLMVLAWAILPALGWAVLGDMIPLLLLLGIVVLAAVLRSTDSWEATLLSSIGVGLGAQLGLQIKPDFVVVMQQQIEQLMNNPELQGQFSAVPPEQLQQLLMVFFGTMLMFLALMLLMLARSWQAALFNPGGFRSEFHRLKLSWKASAALVLVFALVSVGSDEMQQLSLYFVVPLLIAGVALVHGVVGLRRWPVAVLVVFYATLLSPIMTQILLLAAITDSWYDFRARLRPPEQDSSL